MDKGAAGSAGRKRVQVTISFRRFFLLLLPLAKATLRPMKSNITEETCNGISGYRLFSGGYSAFICAHMGANCIQLTKDDVSLLRTPSSREEFAAQPNLYGIPLLFPPNRIKEGRYMFEGREYRFPINEPERGHHIHGFLSSTPFKPKARWYNETQAHISFVYEAAADDPYLQFGHTFKVESAFSLSEDGLGHALTITNTSENEMPVGVGFHTTFNADFLGTGKEEEYVLCLDAGQEILIDRPTFIPTGEYVQSNELLETLRQGTYRPYTQALSNHFTTKREPVHELWYRHQPSRTSIHYSTESPLDYWMLFNKGGCEGFVCAEPQTWIIDAPNSKLAPEQSGFRSLGPQQSLTLRSRLSMTAG